MVLILKFYLMIVACFMAGLSTAATSLNGFDLSNSLVPNKHIVHGGPPRDGIPAIHQPHYATVSEADFMKAEDIVLGFDFQGQRFAFPRYILNWHELVNGRVGGHAFLVSYCPLCGTGMAFSSRVKGQRLAFGVSGLLYNNDLIFYDKNTQSLWSQIEARAISGPYAGEKLKQLYIHTTTWSKWKEDHPDTLVLSEKQGIKRNYRHDPYSGYETSSAIFFKTLRKAPGDYHSKERVLGVNIGGRTKAYPFLELRRMAKASFIDRFGGRQYRVFWDDLNETAWLENLAGEKVSSTIHAYWFAWYAFHPDTEVFKAPQ